MGIYLLSFVCLSFIFACFYKKQLYEKRYLVTLYAALFSFLPLIIVNFIKNDNAERETFVVKSKNLSPINILKDTLPGDTIPRVIDLYVEVDTSERELNFKPNGHYRSEEANSIEVHYIQKDSTNMPRYEVTKERIKSSSRRGWISSLGIPNKNRRLHIYLPNDTNKVILTAQLNEIKKANTN